MVNKLRPVSYNYIGKTEDQIGFIAEEVYALEPRLVDFNDAGLPRGVKYGQITALLTQAIQELSASSTEISTKLDNLISNGGISVDNVWTADESGNIKAVSAGILDLQGKDIKNIGSLISSSGNWSMTNEGKLFVKEVETDKFCMKGICINGDQFESLLQTAGISGSPKNTSPETITPADSTTDSTPPVITLNGLNPANIQEDSTYSDMGASVADNKDNNLGIQVSTWKDDALISDKEAVVDTSSPSTYIIKYNATDSAGNKAGEVTRTVVVGTSVAPAPEPAPEATPSEPTPAPEPTPVTESDSAGNEAHVEEPAAASETAVVEE